MTRPLRICVTLAADGKTLKREIMRGEEVICEVSPVELIEFVMQATSSLRYDVPRGIQ